MSALVNVRTILKWGLPHKKSFWLLLLMITIVLLGGLTYVLLSAEGPQGQDPSITALTPEQVRQILVRNGAGADNVAIDALYAPPWYFKWNNRQAPTTDKPILVFFLFETIHEGVLPTDPPPAILKIDGQQFNSLNATVLSTAEHHRVTQVLFPALDDNGSPLLTQSARNITLLLPINGAVSEDGTFSWDLPLPYGAGAIGGSEVIGHQSMSLAAFFAILGGILAALSPCLMQLTVYYTAALTGSSVEGTTSPTSLTGVRSSMMKTALFFIVGFTIVYTVGGAVAGYIGESLQRLGSLDQWLRPVSIVSGILILILALRTAAQANVPLVCRLPLMRLKAGQKTGFVGSILMGLSFAIGCLSCFSATVLTTLLLYAGATGSPLTGALLMLVFSLGIGLVFLLAALLMAEALPFITFFQKAQRPIGLFSALVMSVFGVLMITDNFHLVSGWLAKLLQLK